MTTQEFVIKESKNFADVEIGDRAKFISPRSVDEWDTSAEGFKNGLTKGIEIAGEFAEWGQRNKYKQSGGKKGNGEWYRQSAGYGGGEPTFYTTSELIEIFLTEKYGK